MMVLIDIMIHQEIIDHAKPSTNRHHLFHRDEESRASAVNSILWWRKNRSHPLVDKEYRGWTNETGHRPEYKDAPVDR
jgi:hypothetical protein